MQNLTAKRAILTGFVVGIILTIIGHISFISNQTGNVTYVIAIVVASPYLLIERLILPSNRIYSYFLFIFIPLISCMLIGYLVFTMSNKNKEPMGLIKLSLRVSGFYLLFSIIMFVSFVLISGIKVDMANK